VWIWYSFLTDVQLRTVDVPLCGVDMVFLLDRCSLRTVDVPLYGVDRIFLIDRCST
jgi:hypothetical protein